MKKLKFTLILFLTLIIVAVSGMFGYNQYLQIKEHHNQVTKLHKQKLAIRKKDKQFTVNESLFLDNAKEAASEAETISTTYQSVWHDAIWDDYVIVNDQFYYGFDEAVIAQQQVFNDDGTISTMDSNYNSMNDAYSNLEKSATKNTKDKLSKYSDIKSSVTELYNLASDTTGETLNNYTSDVSDAVNAVKVDLSY